MTRDIISCNLFKIVGIDKQQTGILLKDIVVGDYLRLSLSLNVVAAKEMEIKNMRTNEVIYMPLHKVVAVLSDFELEEVVSE